MASSSEVSILIPVFNEAARLGDILTAVRALRLTGSEIIVIDDGSTDGSADVAMSAGANVIRHPYNIGNGAAIKTGIRTARGRLLVLMDGDGQHKPEDIPRLLAEARHYHMVVGARAK
jgi:glycosyltransferase involved in cell wall biosynthesis